MDAIIAHLIWVLNEHVQSGQLEGQIFEQSIVTAIGTRLLRAYGLGMRANRVPAVLPRRKLARAESFMRERFRDPIALDDIAAAVSLSPFHLSRAFRAWTGKGVWQFVLECRATEAERLLRTQPDRPLLDLSIDCGFESYSQFIAAFRKFFGQLPSQYRRTLTR
jgi:AraC family transcriptional regulator